MRSPSERNGAVSAFCLAALLVAALWLATSLTGSAVAEPTLSLAQRSQPTFQLAAHHEDDDHDHDEDYDRDHDEDWDEDEEFEMELHHLEVERAALETFFGSLELVEKLGKIAANDDAIAVFAVSTLSDEWDAEDLSEKASYFEEVATKAPSKAARRMARLTLAEIYRDMDRPEDSVQQMTELIFNSK